MNKPLTFSERVFQLDKHNTKPIVCISGVSLLHQLVNGAPGHTAKATSEQKRQTKRKHKVLNANKKIKRSQNIPSVSLPTAFRQMISNQSYSTTSSVLVFFSLQARKEQVVLNDINVKMKHATHMYTHARMLLRSMYAWVCLGELCIEEHSCFCSI